MVRVTLREENGRWHVGVDGTRIGSRPTRLEAEVLAHQTARERQDRPAIEIREAPGVWRTVAP
jgi:hypothetical protein